MLLATDLLHLHSVVEDCSGTACLKAVPTETGDHESAGDSLVGSY